MSGVVEIDAFAVFPLPYLHVSEITSAIIAHYNTPFWIPAGINKDDLE